MIFVCSLNDLDSLCSSINPKYLISVIDPGYVPKTPKGVTHHLKLGFDDIIKVSDENKIFRSNTDEVPQMPPNLDHIDSIVSFINNCDLDEDIIIHCWCGVSRSMATATYLLCYADKLNIDRNIRYIRSIAPHANPNKLMIRLFENYLSLSNKITNAYNKYPHTKAYDCSSNFAPITLFNIKDMKEFK